MLECVSARGQLLQPIVGRAVEMAIDAINRQRIVCGAFRLMAGFTTGSGQGIGKVSCSGAVEGPVVDVLPLRGVIGGGACVGVLLMTAHAKKSHLGVPVILAGAEGGGY